MNKTCKDCVYYLRGKSGWDGSLESFGECHRSYPQIFNKQETLPGHMGSDIKTEYIIVESGWPTVKETDFCGEIIVK